MAFTIPTTVPGTDSIALHKKNPTQPSEDQAVDIQCSTNVTYKFEHVPVEHIVIGEALAMEQISEELSQVGVVRFVIKT